nr:hypothetical protein [Tanacetum cinerariifolium]
MELELEQTQQGSSHEVSVAVYSSLRVPNIKVMEMIRLSEGGDDKHEFDEETRDEESFDPIPQTPKDSEDEGDGEEDLGLNIGEEERHVEEEEEDELYIDFNINQGRGIQETLAVEDSHVTLTLVHPDGQQESSSVSSQFVTSMLNLKLDVGMESIFGTTSQMDVQTPTSVAPLPITAPTMTSSTIATTTTISQAPILPTIVLSDIIQNLPNFGSLFHFDDRIRSLEENFSEFRQTNQFAGVVSSILGIINHYMDQRMNEAVKVTVQIQSDRLRDETQRENDEFLRTVDENIKKIIKEQQLEAEVLTRSSHSSRTSIAVATEPSEMELKKILIEKMEGNKSIQRSGEHKSLYKALVDAYESNKIILDTYRETVTLKRRQDDDVDKDKKPSAGPDRGLKRRRKEKEPKGAYADYLSDERALPSGKPPTPDRDWNKTLLAVHESIQPWISELVKQANSRFFFDELMDTPLDFSNFLMNRLRVDTLTPELLAGPTYELMKGSCKSQQYPHNLLQPLPLIPDNRGRRVIPFEHFINNDLEYLRGGKLTNLTVEEHFSFNVSLRMFTRSIGIQRRVEDLQLGVEIYQKKLNLTKPDTYRSDLKHKEAYTANLNPRGVIYQNKDKKNRLMRIDELHKFSARMLTDVCTALDDHLKGIRMRYLPKKSREKVIKTGQRP